MGFFDFFKKIFKRRDVQKQLPEAVEEKTSPEEAYRESLREEAQKISYEGMSDKDVRLFILKKIGVADELINNPATQQKLLDVMDSHLEELKVYGDGPDPLSGNPERPNYFAGTGKDIEERVATAIEKLTQGGWHQAGKQFIIERGQANEMRFYIGEENSGIRNIREEDGSVKFVHYTPVFVETYYHALHDVYDTQEGEIYVAKKQAYAPDGIEEEKTEIKSGYDHHLTKAPNVDFSIMSFDKVQPGALSSKAISVVRDDDTTARITYGYADGEKNFIRNMNDKNSGTKAKVDLGMLCSNVLLQLLTDKKKFDIATLDALSFEHGSFYDCNCGQIPIYEIDVDSNIYQKSRGIIKGQSQKGDAECEQKAMDESKLASAFKARHEKEKNLDIGE